MMSGGWRTIDRIRIGRAFNTKSSRSPAEFAKSLAPMSRLTERQNGFYLSLGTRGSPHRRPDPSDVAKVERRCFGVNRARIMRAQRGGHFSFRPAMAASLICAFLILTTTYWRAFASLIQIPVKHDGSKLQPWSGQGSI